MAELGAIVCPPAVAYLAAALGSLVGLWLSRIRKDGTAAEATWAALLAPGAVLLIPFVSLLQIESAAAFVPLHTVWHRLESAIHASPAAHGLLHAGNWLLLAFVLWRAFGAIRAGAAMLAFARALPGGQVVLEAGASYVLLPSERALCFTAGLLRPVTYLTSALRDAVSPRELGAMLAHEAEHVRRRDGALNAFLTLVYTLFPVPGGRRLMTDWQQAAERECDAAAARRLRSPCDVAGALVRIEALVAHGGAPVPAGVCFARGEGSIEPRIHALLAMPSDGASSASPGMGSWIPALLGLLLLLAGGTWVHHAVALFAHH